MFFFVQAYKNQLKSREETQVNKVVFKFGLTGCDKGTLLRQTLKYMHTLYTEMSCFSPLSSIDQLLY